MSTATDMLQKYIDAEKAVMDGQEVRLDGKHLRRADLNFIQNGRREWQRAVNTEARIASGGSSTRFQTPDFT